MLIARRNDVNCIITNLWSVLLVIANFYFYWQHFIIKHVIPRILAGGYLLVFFLLMLNNSIAFAYKYNLKAPISINSLEKIKKDRAKY